MNYIKTLLLALVLTLALPSQASDALINDPLVFVRVIECKGGDTANESMILIDRGTGSIERIELDKFNKKSFEANFKIIAATLNSICSEGYTLISSSTGGGDDNAMLLQNYIFEKR